MKNGSGAFPAEVFCLAAGVAWLLFVQLLAVLAWDFDLLTRQAAILHWIVVGVLPPALALLSMPDPAARDC